MVFLGRIKSQTKQLHQIQIVLIANPSRQVGKVGCGVLGMRPCSGAYFFRKPYSYTFGSIFLARDFCFSRKALSRAV